MDLYDQRAQLLFISIQVLLLLLPSNHDNKRGKKRLKSAEEISLTFCAQSNAKSWNLLGITHVLILVPEGNQTREFYVDQEIACYIPQYGGKGVLAVFALALLRNQ